MDRRRRTEGKNKTSIVNRERNQGTRSQDGEYDKSVEENEQAD